MDISSIYRKEIHIKGLKENYTFVHITDMHMMLYGANETEARAAYALPRIEMFSRGGPRPKDYFEKFIAYANHIKPTGVLLSGDIVDFPSKENIAFLQEKLSELQVPYLYVVGNHDWSYFDNYHTEDSFNKERPLFAPISEGDVGFHTKKFGELTFVALDNSEDRYAPDTAKRLKQVLDNNENVIVLQHIPFYCNTLHDDAVEFWRGADYSLGKPATASDNSADEIKDILVSHSSAKAIICGHLHFTHEDMLDGILPQFITKESNTGELAIFEIHG